MADNINEDLPDLIDDGAAEATSAPVRRREPPPPQAPPPHGDKKGQKAPDKTGGGKKKKGGFIALIIVGVFIILIGAFVTLMILNVFSLRDIVGGVLKDPLIDVVVWFDPEFSSIEKSIRKAGDEREAALNERERGIAGREAELAGLEGSLNDRETQLDRRSDALDRREQNISQSENTTSGVPVYQRVLTEQEITEMRSLSRSFSSMTAESAAAVLAELYSLEDAATILYYMTERNAGLILQAMDVELAARITEQLLGSSPEPLGGLPR